MFIIVNKTDSFKRICFSISNFSFDIKNWTFYVRICERSSSFSLLLPSRICLAQLNILQDCLLFRLKYLKHFKRLVYLATQYERSLVFCISSKLQQKQILTQHAIYLLIIVITKIYEEIINETDFKLIQKMKIYKFQCRTNIRTCYISA